MRAPVFGSCFENISKISPSTLLGKGDALGRVLIVQELPLLKDECVKKM